ncbi:MAG: hypothetical protein FWC14_01035 [Candidatus Bathyarchaeota archaeon]|uniref:hypothetical protein n=1 Tax=Candidatus Bathycorpusculum sp. TaxID=2994959 RepID=UPI0028283195|nr:hypothetical protein [Candidatus Termiticorpusculum sp.]MCL2293155.1 hypothetical protein [Candidatus Termiticorpusculum sp.]
MVVEQFNVSTSSPSGMDTIAVTLLIVGIVLLIVNLLLYRYLKDHSISGKHSLAIIGIILIIAGGILYGATSPSTASVVTVGDGYINVEASHFTYHGAIFGARSNKNATSEEITTAFVGEVGSGNFSLHKDYGLNFGDTNVGRYTLGNGATAYMATTNSTCLIVELKNGEYLIVGNSDTQAIAHSFSQNVYPLAP